VEGGVATLTLDRPAHGNRIDQDTAAALCDIVAEIELNEAVAIIVLAARGRYFCLGVDAPGAWAERHDWVAAVGGATRPVVALIQGDAVAEGCELALACDLRIAAAGARFCLPQLGEGRLPQHGATQRLPRLVGRTRALEILLSGRTVGAREAARIGLVSEVVPRRALRAAAARTVAALRAKAPVALRLAKEAVLKGMDLTLEQGIRLEQDLYVLLQTTADRREGIRAFLKRRPPRFRGR
jgi:enoyl-CoA hydratase/carnithine racemase